MKTCLLSVSALLFFFASARASHIVGGEMHYQYLGNNNYHIVLKVYRDCYNGTAPYDDPLYLAIYDSLNTLIQDVSIPFPGSLVLPNNANNPCLIVPPNICVEEAVYETDVTLPPLAHGYNLCWQRCCRNNSILNIFDPANTGATYTSHIPGMWAGNNSDPYYNNFPPTVICSTVPLTFDHSATDADGDSLVYSFCAPYIGATSGAPTPNPPAPPPYTDVTYVSPYTATNPIGGSPPLSLDPNTGMLTGVPVDLGQFVVGICVKEYRNGQLLSEHKRDFQFNVTNCTQSIQAITTPQIINCHDLTVSFSNQSVGGLFFHWDFGVAGINTDTSNAFAPTYTFPDTGTYVATFMVNPGTVCSDTATTVVTLYPTLTPAMLSPDGCSGNPIQFGDQSVSTYGTINQWHWTFGDGGTSNAQNPSHVYPNPGNYNVQLIVTTNLGCTDTVSDPIVILTGPINSVYGDTTICKQDQAQIGVDAIGVYHWTPNYNITTDTSANPIVAPDVTTTYQVIAVSPDGCMDSATVVITVADTVIAVITPADTSVCPGALVTLLGSGGLTHAWSPATNLSSTNTAQTVATLNNTGNYNFTYTTSVGSCVSSAAAHILVLPLPTPSAAGPYSICKGDSVQLVTSGANKFLWSPPDGLSNVHAGNPWAAPLQTTQYIVQLQDTNACPIVVFDTVMVTVMSDNYIISPETTIVLGTSALLTVNNGSQFTWTPATGLNDAHAQNPVASPTVTTTYTVTITFATGCTAVDSMIVIVDPNPQIIFPNAFTPNGDGLNDRFRPWYIGLIDVEEFRIYNRWGQLVYESTSLDGWDGTSNGKEQEVGTYAYYLVGHSHVGGKQLTYQGNFTLMR